MAPRIFQFSRLILIFLFGLIWGISSAEQEANPFQPSDDAMADVDAVLEQAKMENKLALIVMGATWCHDSMSLYDHFQDAELRETLETNFKVLFVDVGFLTKGKEIIQRFGQPVIYGTPTVLIINPETEELLNQQSMHRLRDSTKMDINEARAYFADKASGGLPEINLHPNDPQLSALYQEIEKFENEQAARIYRGFAVIGPLLEASETGNEADYFMDYWRELSKFRYTITGDLEHLRKEARDKVGAGETNITLDYPEYPSFTWEKGN